MRQLFYSQKLGNLENLGDFWPVYEMTWSADLFPWAGNRLPICRKAYSIYVDTTISMSFRSI